VPCGVGDWAHCSAAGPQPGQRLSSSLQKGDHEVPNLHR
jgi:hypothetical protein